MDGGRTASTAPDLAPFVLGVNYWPRRKAMSWWSAFDPGEVRDEFDVIAEVGLGLVRVFRLWEHWQPSPLEVDAAALENLGQVCDIAAVALPDYRSVPGNLAAYVLRRAEGEQAHFVTLTFWTSTEAIRSFAGSDIDRAKYYPEDRDLLLEFEPTVQHYEVYAAQEPASPPAAG